MFMAPVELADFAGSKRQRDVGLLWPCRNLRAKSAGLESVLFQYVVAHAVG
jgi:hypothetical protein